MHRPSQDWQAQIGWMHADTLSVVGHVSHGGVRVLQVVGHGLVGRHIYSIVIRCKNPSRQISLSVLSSRIEIWNCLTCLSPVSPSRRLATPSRSSPLSGLWVRPVWVWVWAQFLLAPDSQLQRAPCIQLRCQFPTFESDIRFPHDKPCNTAAMTTD